MNTLNSENREKKKKLYLSLLIILLTLTVYEMISLNTSSSVMRSAYAKPISGDLDKDGDVDIDDLQLFSRKWLGLDWQDVVWCDWITQSGDGQKHIGGLRDFVVEYFQCDSTEPPKPPVDPLAVVNDNDYPIGLAVDQANYLYVTDYKAGSVFIYDPNFVVTAELKGFSKPLGVAVDTQGNIYVGNSGKKSVEKYNPSGVKIAVVANNIELANDLEFDLAGNLYVTDAKAHKVRVFDTNLTEQSSITHGNLKYPTAIAIDYVDDGTGQMVGELFVSSFVDIEDDPNFIQVFDLAGNLKRHYGVQVTKSMMGSLKWQGKFIRIQSMKIGPAGNLHVLDPTMGRIQIINPVTGAYISYYGALGTQPGQLRLPLDFVIDQNGAVFVANYGNKRLEIIHVLP